MEVSASFESSALLKGLRSVKFDTPFLKSKVSEVPNQHNLSNRAGEFKSQADARLKQILFEEMDTLPLIRKDPTCIRTRLHTSKQKKGRKENMDGGGFEKMNSYDLKPFVKWVGGKSQLISEISKRLPDDITEYCEPFVGGGAVLFYILQNYSPKKITINDINETLIHTYIAIRDKVDELISYLSVLEGEYVCLQGDKVKEYYYNIRDIYNRTSSSVYKDALFLFLNRTCYNGLYRVNSRGEFNTPAGSYSHPLICNEPLLYACSKALSNTDILCGDYKKCISAATVNTFIYADPPYKDTFTSYSAERFSDKDQEDLHKALKKASLKGAKFMLSNSDPGDYFDKLYKEFYIERVSAKRAINSKGTGRGAVPEVLITNYSNMEVAA